MTSRPAAAAEWERLLMVGVNAHTAAILADATDRGGVVRGDDERAWWRLTKRGALPSPAAQAEHNRAERARQDAARRAAGRPARPYARGGAGLRGRQVDTPT